MIKFACAALALALTTACGQAATTSAPAPAQPELRQTEYRQGDIRIAYPQVASLKDRAMQDKLNDALKKKAMQAADSYQGADGKVTLDIGSSGELKPSGLLSVAFSGYADVEGTAHPSSLFYTANYDWKTGDPLRLTDLAKIDAAFVKKLKASKPKDVDPDSAEMAARAYLDESNNDLDWLETVGNADLGNESDTYSYVTKDALGVSFGVPHALGDHVAYEIPFADLAGTLTPRGQRLLGMDE